MADSPSASIIIPVLNEAGCLDRSLARLFALRWVTDHCEVILCDGGSQDETLAIAGRYPCRVVQADPGRATQMNAGAKTASGLHLLFLHADSSLPSAMDEVAGSPIRPDSDWGFFRLRLDGSAPVYRVIETMINLRSRLTRVAGGDQGLFFRRDFFHRIGGFPAIPLMEDVAVCKTARRESRPQVVAAALTSSSRRWREAGVVRTILLMWSLRFAYWVGADPARLHRLYYPQRN